MRHYGKRAWPLTSGLPGNVAKALVEFGRDLRHRVQQLACGLCGCLQPFKAFGCAIWRKRFQSSALEFICY